MKKFNDPVTYVRNGEELPAIVLKSSLDGDQELLALLYADPDAGPQLVMQGAVNKTGAYAFAVKPFREGAAYGWKELVGSEADIENLQTAAVVNHAALEKKIADLETALKANEDTQAQLADQVKALSDENAALKAQQQ